MKSRQFSFCQHRRLNLTPCALLPPPDPAAVPAAVHGVAVLHQRPDHRQRHHAAALPQGHRARKIRQVRQGPRTDAGNDHVLERMCLLSLFLFSYYHFINTLTSLHCLLSFSQGGAVVEARSGTVAAVARRGVRAQPPHPRQRAQPLLLRNVPQNSYLIYVPTYFGREGRGNEMLLSVNML